MKTIIHTADSRGTAEFGWLHSKHSFSFGNYYNSGKMGFGLLRVLNDDFVEPGEGFGKHPHNNMEIISIILEGELAHKDSMGNGSVIKAGDIQVMSAGTGIMHSEFNNSKEAPVKFLQIWIIPKERGIEPRYDQKYFSEEEKQNKLLKVVSGNKDEGLYIHQDAAIYSGNFEKENIQIFEIAQNHGIYLFVLEGSINFDNQTINKRDALGVYDTERIRFSTSPKTKFILIDVPMN